MTEPQLPGMGPGVGAGAPAHLLSRVHSCRSCGAPILWASTRDHRTMPVDAAPSVGGNVFVVLDGGTLRATVGAPDVAPDGSTRHLSHFATCSHADRHRKPRGGR